MVDYAPLWYWVKEREAIRERKLRRPVGAPLTGDPILAAYRFCNVRREDDRVTIWIRKHIREPFADHPLLWLMLCIARQINWPETLAVAMYGVSDTGDDWIGRNQGDAWPSHPHWRPDLLTELLEDRKEQGAKVWTGAYVISAGSEKGQPKSRYIAETVIGTLWQRIGTFRLLFGGKPSLRDVHMDLMRFPGWGAFMAYQAVVDMRFTKLLEHAADRQKWAAAGPGTIRGLNRLHGRRLDFSLPQDRALEEMRAIYERVTDETGVVMDFSDVPNILCETDKYLRVKNGEGKPRATYVPGRGW